MTNKDHKIRYSASVNHPCKKVRNALTEDAISVFQNATKGAASDADSVAVELHAKIGGLELTKDIAISVTNIDLGAHAPKSWTATRLDLEWEATHLPRLFPLMKAELLLYPLSGTETQLDFTGSYEPPAGALGDAIDSFIGQRIAKVSVKRFFDDVATYLRTALQRKR